MHFGKTIIALTMLASASVASASIGKLSTFNLEATGSYYTTLSGLSLGKSILSETDDGSARFDLGFNFTFAGKTYTNLWVNNNGNITFGSGSTIFDPAQAGAVPRIAALFTDLDSRNKHGNVYARTNGANEVIVTWDKLGDFRNQSVNSSFQAVIRGDNYNFLSPEDGQIGFYFKNLGTTKTNAVNGVFDGKGNGYVMDGSGTAALPGSLQGKSYWISQGQVAAVPEPETWALLGLGLSGILLRRRRAR